MATESPEQIKQQSYQIKKYLADKGLDIKLADAQELASQLAGHRDWNTAAAVAKKDRQFSQVEHQGFGPRKGDVFLQIFAADDKAAPFATFELPEDVKWMDMFRGLRKENINHACAVLNIYAATLKEMGKYYEAGLAPLVPSCHPKKWLHFWVSEEKSSSGDKGYWAVADINKTKIDFCKIMGMNGQFLVENSPEAEEARQKAVYLVAALELHEWTTKESVGYFCEECGSSFPVDKYCPKCTLDEAPVELLPPSFATICPGVSGQDDQGSGCRVKDVGFVFKDDQALRSLLKKCVDSNGINLEALRDWESGLSCFDTFTVIGGEKARHKAINTLHGKGFVVATLEEGCHFLQKLEEEAKSAGLLR